MEPLLEALRRSHLIGAGEALANFRETRAIPLLAECLSDAFSRERVVAALLQFGREAVEALVAALRTIELKGGAETPRSTERRAACARLLGEIKDSRGEAVLRESLEDPAPEVRRSAAVALARVAPEARLPERVRSASAMAKRRTLWDYNEMGLYFYGREAYDLAIGEFKRALKAAFYPIAALHINLGAAYLGKKMYADARAHLSKGLALEPRNQKAHWFLAQTLKATGGSSEALTEFERTWTINPDSVEGRRAREEIRVLTPSHAGSLHGERR